MGFDGLCEDVASLPRRFGLAPSWEKEYGTVERRTASRKAMFDMLDLRQGPPRGWIGLEQFVNWATDHLITKVATIDITQMSTITTLSSTASTSTCPTLRRPSPTQPPAHTHLSTSSFWPSSLSATPAPLACSPLPSSISFCPVPPRCPAPSAWPLLRPARRPARSSSTAWRTSRWVV